MYDQPATKVQPQVKREITGPIEEHEDEDDSSSESSKENEENVDGFVVVDGQNAEDIKKAKRKVKLEMAAMRAAQELEKNQQRQEEQKKDKILTFRDMSHLSYFGG